MSGSYHSLAQAFGPLVQVIFFFFILFLTAWCIAAIAFWSERKLLMAKSCTLAILPLPIFAIGMLYGGFRFSGQIRYPSDNWDQWGLWNYTNQNCGALICFLCVCILTGVILAMYKEKFSLKN